MLIQRLFEEAKDVVFTCQFVEDGQMLRIQRKKYVHLHQKIVAVWDEFSTGSMTPDDLLRRCSFLNGPSIDADHRPQAE
jgi:hypothetical protein